MYIGHISTDGDSPRLGITFDDLMREDGRRGHYPDAVGDEEAFIAQRIAAHREGAGRPVNFRIASGRWQQARDYRLPDGSTVVVRSDVSELVERDRALRESQTSLAAAQRIAKLGSWELDFTDPPDIDRNSLRWSDETFRIFGYEPGEIEVSSASFFHAVHPDDRDKVREATRRAIETGTTYSIEHRVLRPDGREVIVHEKSDVIYGPDGRRPVKMVGTVQNVTEQRVAEAKRDEFRALLEATSEASPDGILVTDARGRYLFWNKRLKEMWNLPEDYLQSRRGLVMGADSLLGPHTDQIVDPRSFRDEVQRMYDQHQPPAAALEDILLKDGRVLVGHGARVAAGKLPYATVAWIYRDVTEQRKRDAVLAQTQRLTTVGELSSGMAHELNNLLMEIGGNLELIEMQERHSDDVRTTELLKMAQSAIDRGAELIRHLLAFSRRQPLAPRLTDVNELMADAMKTLPQLLGESVTMKFLPGGTLWRTVVDPGSLRTTLVSLATNARDAMPGGGSLIIETSNHSLDESHVEKLAEVTAGEYVLITVTDDGAGMPPEVAKRAFEPFFTTKPVGRGTGLGLSVAYGFVKQSGGHVAIDSKEGNGTSVRIYLPRASSDSVAGTAGAAGASTGVLSTE
jgi:PAS domain S-box-containing protein